MRTDSTLHFDGHLFDGLNLRNPHSHYPVRVRYMGLDRWDTTGLSFDDFASMHRESKVQFHGRDHTAVPTFALNVPEMKLLLARFFECRAGWRTPKIGEPEWRLKMALRHIQKNVPKDHARMVRLNREYVELKRQGGDTERLRELENTIRSLDGEIIMARRGAAPIVALIYFHFRLGYNSVQTANELRMTAQSVRKIAFRLTKLWNKMKDGQDAQPSAKERANAQVRERRRNFTPEQREAFKKYQADYLKANKKAALVRSQKWRDANLEHARKISRESTARYLKKKKAEGGQGVPFARNAPMFEPALNR
jgi:hypothetical protein